MFLKGTVGLWLLLLPLFLLPGHKVHDIPLPRILDTISCHFSKATDAIIIIETL